MKLSILSETIEHEIEPKDDGWIIRTPYGYIDYVHNEEGDNEIWWVESNRRGHGSELVDLMQKYHPSDFIHWGVTSQSGRGLMKKWHKLHPEVGYSDTPHEGQFNSFD